MSSNPTKRIWLITYGSSSPSIDRTLLWDADVYVDECYTATWRESKYTLIHLPRGNPITADALTKLPGVILSEIFGFGSIVSRGESLESHPGFMHMVQLLNTRPQDLEAWTASCVPLASYRRGLLWKYIENTPPEKMTRTQLIKRARQLGSKTEECSRLTEHNGVMLQHLHELWEEHVELRTKVTDIEGELKQTQEVSALHERIAKLHEERVSTCQAYCEKLSAYTEKLHVHLEASIEHCHALQAEIKRLKAQ